MGAAFVQGVEHFDLPSNPKGDVQTILKEATVRKRDAYTFEPLQKAPRLTSPWFMHILNYWGSHM